MIMKQIATGTMLNYIKTSWLIDSVATIALCALNNSKHSHVL